MFVKIRINKTDTFGVDIPDEMDLETFYGFVDRIISIQKMLGRGYNKGFLDLELPTLPTNKSAKGEDKDEDVKSNDSIELFTRDIMVRLLRAYWTFPFEESERRLNKVITDYELPIESREDIKKMIFKARNKYKIMPEEVNLKRFPGPGDSNLKDLALE